MTISIKEYAAAVGITQAAAYKRLNSGRYSRFLVVDDHGKKRVNTAIFDADTSIQPDSTVSTKDSTEVERNSTNSVENSTVFSTYSTDSTVSVENSTENSTSDSTDSTKEVENSTKNSTEVERDSTEDSTDSTIFSTTVETKTAILQVKLDYAMRDTVRLERQLEDARQQINDMRVQLQAKDHQIDELNERLRESHIIAHAAQQKPRFFLTGIIGRLRGRKAEGDTENDTQ